MTEWLGLPALASAHGGQIDNMLGWVHVFMLILFVGWGGFYAYCLVRFRRSRNPVADYAGVKSHRSTYLEVGVAVVEAVLLFGFAIPLWAARIDRMPAESEALVVRVTGEQFAWNIHYPGPDRVFGHRHRLLDLQSNPWRSIAPIPPQGRRHDVNQPLSAREQADHRAAPSKDVIHSFGVPELRVAGRHSRPHDPDLVRAHRHDRGDADAGECRVPARDACAQLCGLGHAAMRGFVTIQTAEEFDKWMDERVKELSAPDPFGRACLRPSRSARSILRLRLQPSGFGILWTAQSESASGP